MCSSDSNVVCEGEHDRVTPDTWGWTHTLRTVSYILFLIVGSEKNVKLFLKIYVYANCQRDAGPFLPLPAGKKSKVWRDLSFIYSMNIFHFNWFLDSVRTDLIPSFTVTATSVCELLYSWGRLDHRRSLSHHGSQTHMMAVPCVLCSFTPKILGAYQWRTEHSYNAWKGSCLYSQPYTCPGVRLLSPRLFSSYYTISSQNLGSKKMWSCLNSSSLWDFRNRMWGHEGWEVVSQGSEVFPWERLKLITHLIQQECWSRAVLPIRHQKPHAWLRAQSRWTRTGRHFEPRLPYLCPLLSF